MNRSHLLLVSGMFCVAALSGLLAPALWSSPSFANRAEPVKPQFGICDVWTIAYELSRSDRYKDEDDRLRAEYERSIKPLSDQLEALSKTLKEQNDEEGRPGSNEERERAMNEYYEMMDTLDEKRQEFSAHREGVYARRMIECCRKVCEVADEIAEEQGFLYVFASCDVDAYRKLGAVVTRENRGDSEKNEAQDEAAETYDNVYYSERFRTVASAPPEARIDDLIRDRLNLKPIP